MYVISRKWNLPVEAYHSWNSIKDVVSIKCHFLIIIRQSLYVIHPIPVSTWCNVTKCKLSIPSNSIYFTWHFFPHLKAITGLHKGLELSPDSAEGHFNLGVLLFNKVIVNEPQPIALLLLFYICYLCVCVCCLCVCVLLTDSFNLHTKG